MRIPERAPSLTESIAAMTASGSAERLTSLMPFIAATTHAGRYLHWADMRHRVPPSGLSRHEWWLATLLGRESQFQALPLAAKDGRPFRFALPGPVMIDLHHIDRDAAGRIQAADGTPSASDPQRYLLSSFFEEAITSSQLEGASTTRREAAAMLRSGRKPRDKSEKMIFNNYRAMESVRALKGESLTPARVLDLHRMLTEGTLDDPADAGRLRQSDDVHVVDGRDNSIIHEPPPCSELPRRLAELCDFANAGENASPFVHPVVRAILLHFMIGYDHPFVDGNGRVARALFYWAMARGGYWMMEYASISHILRKAPARYMRAYLYSETDNNDTTYFLLHQLATIRRAIAALHEYLDQKTRERRETEQLMASSPNLRTRFNHRQVTLLNHALRTTGEPYRIDVHRNSQRVSYQTARNDLLSLEEMGLLERDKQGNAYVFFAPGDLRDRLAAIAKTP